MSSSLVLILQPAGGLVAMSPSSYSGIVRIATSALGRTDATDLHYPLVRHTECTFSAWQGEEGGRL